MKLKEANYKGLNLENQTSIIASNYTGQNQSVDRSVEIRAEHAYSINVDSRGRSLPPLNYKSIQIPIHYLNKHFMRFNEIKKQELYQQSLIKTIKKRNKQQI